MSSRLVVALAVVSLAPFAAQAKFMSPVAAPVDRLIANTERALIGQPNSADLNYRRGRLYALLAVQKEVHVMGDLELNNFTVMSRNNVVLSAEATDPVRTALKTSIGAYKAAIKASPDHALAHLGLAWALEAATVAKLPGASMKEALGEYKKAFELAQAQDGKLTEQPMSLLGLDGLVSYEAAEAYVRAGETNGGDATFTTAAKEHLKKLKALPRSSKVTPIVFSRSGKATALAQLEDTSRCSTFDLDGTQRGNCWSWLTADAGILVWDPTGRGEVKNGWQLFGSVSFFMFFQHGYEALGALDDDGDGWLAGNELPGLAVWTDANRDGQPQPNEVQPVSALGIRRIAVRASKSSAGVWQQARGLELSDGTFRPTWDWVSHPQKAAPLAGAQR
jgi:hypothetical protein